MCFSSPQPRLLCFQRGPCGVRSVTINGSVRSAPACLSVGCSYGIVSDLRPVPSYHAIHDECHRQAKPTHGRRRGKDTQPHRESVNAAQRQARERQCRRSAGRREDSWHEPRHSTASCVHALHASWLWPAGHVSLQWMDADADAVPIVPMPRFNGVAVQRLGSARTYCCIYRFTDGWHPWLFDFTITFAVDKQPPHRMLQRRSGEPSAIPPREHSQRCRCSSKPCRGTAPCQRMKEAAHSGQTVET